jgi:uroporphyrinogen-III decarboxylase
MEDLSDILPLTVPPGTSFSSQWMARNAGWSCLKEDQLDPTKQCAMKLDVETALHRIFPEIYKGKPNADNSKRKPNLSISPTGTVTMAEVFGCEIKYTKELDPWAIPIVKDDSDALSIRLPNMDDRLHWLAENHDRFKSVYPNASFNAPDLQGPLNIAYKLCGDKIFQYIRRESKKNIGHHLMQVVTDSYIEAQKWVRKLLGKPARMEFQIAECTSFFVGPKTFEEFNFHYDLQAIKELGPVRIHSCGLTTNVKLDIIATFPNLASVELGFGTDLKYARQVFQSKERGRLPISARVEPKRMMNEPPSQIRADVNWIIENAKGGPLSINCVGVPYETPKENILAMYKTCWEYDERHAKELDEDE